MTPEELKQSSKDVKPLSRRGFLKLAGITIAGVLTGTLFKSKESTEATNQPDNPIYFTDTLGRTRKWTFDNARFGIPPNDTDRMVGTIDDEVNGSISAYIQPYTPGYPEINQGKGIDVLIGGVLVKVPWDKFYLATVVSENRPGIYYPRFERKTNINNPANGSSQIIKDGLPQGGTWGDTFSSLSFVIDSNGTFIDAGIKNSITVSENGIYRIRLDQNGDFILPFIKVTLAEPTLTPTSTATPKPSPTATSTPSSTPTLNKKIYIPSVMKNTPGK